MDNSQSVELRDRAGMAVTVLTLQQCWIAPRWVAQMTLAGWAEQSHTSQLMGRAQAKPITVPGSNRLHRSLARTTADRRSTHPTNRAHSKSEGDERRKFRLSD